MAGGTGRHVKRRKRSKTSHDDLGDAFSPFDILPNEMVVSIFLHLDSVTRYSIARVCRRWESILSEKSLRKVITIDLSYLPSGSSPLHVELKERETAHEGLLMTTVCFLLEKHPAADTLHIYHSAQPQCTSVTCAPNCDTSLKEAKLKERITQLKEENLQLMLNLLLLSLSDGHSRCGRRFLKTFVLEDIEVPMKCLLIRLDDRYLQPLFKMVGCVVLRNVEITGLSIPSLDPEVEESTGLRRTVSCRLLPESFPDRALFELLALQEAPLSAGEEEQYSQVVATVRQNDSWAAIDTIGGALGVSIGHRPEREEILTGAALNGFWKRVVIADREWLEQLVDSDSDSGSGSDSDD